jgi:hypothetical protein
MNHTANIPRSAVEKALEVARATFEQYQHVFNRSSAKLDNSILPAVGSALERICDQLESIVDDEDVCLRLCDISVCRQECQLILMDGLLGDLESIRLHLENAGRGTSTIDKIDVDGYVGALKRYVEVLKMVQKRNIKFVLSTPHLCTCLLAYSET